MSVIYISTNESRACPSYGEFLEGENFEKNVNHLIAHGYKLEHVGQQTTENYENYENSSLYQHTVAVLSL